MCPADAQHRGHESTYREIPKLPELREKFMTLYNEILEEQSAPVVKAIKDDRNRVLEVLNNKPYKDAKHSGYMEQFEELLDGAVHCNNVSVLRSYQDKSDALKIRLLNEMVAEDNRLAQQALAQAEAEQKRLAEEARKRGETVTVPQPKVQQPAVKVRTTKNTLYQNGGQGGIVAAGKCSRCGQVPVCPAGKPAERDRG
mgnify:CR=1 FL=1